MLRLRHIVAATIGNGLEFYDFVTALALIPTWLIQSTGSAMAPGWHLTVANIVGLGAMLLMRESAPHRLGALIPRTPVPGRSLPARR